MISNVELLSLSVVLRSGNWRVRWWTWTTRPCGMTTASLSLSTTAWCSPLSSHALEKEVGSMCNRVITQQRIILYCSECKWRTAKAWVSTMSFSLNFRFLAFCRQDEIESRLLKIEGLITSLGKNMLSGKWALKMAKCKMKVSVFLCLFFPYIFPLGGQNTARPSKAGKSFVFIPTEFV